MTIHIHHTFENHDRIELWYDRSPRCWFAARFDSYGFQIEEAVDGYTREDVEYLAQQWIEDHAEWTSGRFETRNLRVSENLYEQGIEDELLIIDRVADRSVYATLHDFRGQNITLDAFKRCVASKGHHRACEIFWKIETGEDIRH